MRDLRILSRKTLLEITNVFPLRGVFPRSVLLKGPQLSRTTEVVYNGIPCPSFSVDSMTTVIAQIPASQEGRSLTNLQAFSDAMPEEGAAKISLSMISPVRAVSGLDRLIQTWMVVFLTGRGSSVFAPTSGGGGRDVVGRTYGSLNPPIGDLTRAVQLTEAEIFASQAQASNLPRDERLLMAPLEGIEQDEASTTIYARVSIRNYLGELASVSL